ncbi:gamma-aminobutyric acid type B receptor subunit 2-like [Amphiura filiformis]|uniref:gamma-aminobutyric acid type B receptor subunit 2-like n=1 Tax=Amphiura filiformis TaxID=82378 RepID=UPI003B2264A3
MRDGNNTVLSRKAARKKGVINDLEFASNLLAYYNAKEDVFDWQDQVRWIDGKVPLDHTPKIIITIVRLHMGISWNSFIGMAVLSCLGVLLAVFFLGFNIKYRYHRIVKMSSPNLNNIIILGIILIFLSVLAGGFDSRLVSRNIQQVACQVRAWLLSIGFVLAFGSMFSKTWRVYRVAALKTPKRRKITDNQLYIMVICFFGLDVCVLTLWQILDPFYVEVIDLYERMISVLKHQNEDLQKSSVSTSGPGGSSGSVPHVETNQGIHSDERNIQLENELRKQYDGTYIPGNDSEDDWQRKITSCGADCTDDGIDNIALASKLTSNYKIDQGSEILA